jgi:hypothetical protein
MICYKPSQFDDCRAASSKCVYVSSILSVAAAAGMLTLTRSQHCLSAYEQCLTYNVTSQMCTQCRSVLICLLHTQVLWFYKTNRLAMAPGDLEIVAIDTNMGGPPVEKVTCLLQLLELKTSLGNEALLGATLCSKLRYCTYSCATWALQLDKCVSGVVDVMHTVLLYTTA